MQKLIPNPNIRIPLYFVMFFVTLAILDAFFVYTALSTHNGVITENAYEKGLRYNQTIKNAEKDVFTHQEINVQQMENSKADISYSINFDGDIKSVILQVIRPIEKDLDFETSLTLDKSQNNYSAIISFPKKGNWDLLVITKTADAEFRKKKRIFVK